MKKLRNKKLFKLHPKKTILTACFLAMLNMQAYAMLGDNIKATPPYRLKSTKATLVNVSGLTPAQVLNAYNFSSISAQGEGVTIAIVDAYDNPNAESDLNTFSTNFNLPACTTANGCFSKVFAS
ncbi:MAG: hypothetical protein JO131_09195, partial [Gammaproteobacteria bacterium]|nr:hypothetical protein [Gammaproteobacteria bacterium]